MTLATVAWGFTIAVARSRPRCRLCLTKSSPSTKSRSNSFFLPRQALLVSTTGDLTVWPSPDFPQFVLFSGGGPRQRSEVLVSSQVVTFLPIRCFRDGSFLFSNDSKSLPTRGLTCVLSWRSRCLSYPKKPLPVRSLVPWEWPESGFQEELMRDIRKRFGIHRDGDRAFSTVELLIV